MCATVKRTTLRVKQLCDIISWFYSSLFVFFAGIQFNVSGYGSFCIQSIKFAEENESAALKLETPIVCWESYE